jgi:hypothetical protein
MRSPISKKCFEYCIAALAMLAPMHGERAIGEDTNGRRGFHYKIIDDRSLGLWEGNRPVLVYNFSEMTLPGVRAAGSRSSYIHPIYGLAGEVLTDDFPADHYHHHGLFWGWPHVTIAGREYDLWKMRGIRIGFQRWIEKEVDDEGATLSVENGWFVREKQVMREVVTLKVQPASADEQSIDVALAWTPTDEPITLGGAEGKSYGGVSLRFAPRTGTTVTVPDGRTAEDLLIAKLPWADLSATFRGAQSPSGAALFVHPQHPDFPPEWMTREYGLLAVGWPGVKPRTLRTGETTTCRYRVWIHGGLRDAADIDAAYQTYRDGESSDD